MLAKLSIMIVPVASTLMILGSSVLGSMLHFYPVNLAWYVPSPPIRLDQKARPHVHDPKLPSGLSNFKGKEVLHWEPLARIQDLQRDDLVLVRYMQDDSLFYLHTSHGTL